MTQTLTEGTSATYTNILEIDSGPYGVIGTYNCSIANSIGSDDESITIQGQSL